MSAMDINTELERRLQVHFDEGDTWEKIKTKSGCTQMAEANYKSVFKEVIRYMGGCVVREAGSQQKNDLTVLWPAAEITYELKKLDKKNGMFMLNDTIPEGDVVYVFFLTNSKNVKVCDDMNNLLKKNMALKERDYCNEKNIEKIRTLLDSIEEEPTATSVLLFGHEVMNLIAHYVDNKIITLFQFGQFFKRTYNFTTCQFRPRPNFSIFYKTIFN